MDPSPRFPSPATPAGDLAHWARTPGRDGVFSDEMAEFCVSGVSINVAARGPGGRPIAGQALAARVEAGWRVRVLLRQPANRSLLAAVEDGSPVAATFSRTVDHRSLQIKAARGEIAKPLPDDLSAAMEQTAAFRDALIAIGYSPAFAALILAYTPGELSVLSFVPERAFVQTPGAGAGSEIAP